MPVNFDDTNKEEFVKAVIYHCHKCKCGKSDCNCKENTDIRKRYAEKKYTHEKAKLCHTYANKILESLRVGTVIKNFMAFEKYTSNPPSECTGIRNFPTKEGEIIKHDSCRDGNCCFGSLMLTCDTCKWIETTT
ncbi:MAG: hypothetical protein LBD23_10085 [Oscillospiraceae bacterium]|nr:hypothetical protein [Oscillospiraceae bacterium]